VGALGKFSQDNWRLRGHEWQRDADDERNRPLRIEWFSHRTGGAVMMMKAARRHHVLLSLQRALLGEVTPTMRAVTVRYDEATARITIYFDGPLTDADRDTASRIETEVMADMSDPNTVSSTCERVDRPEKIVDSGTWVFARNES
jgi:hypothetical protein